MYVTHSFAENGRLKILAFVYGSKEVVLSTGRAIGRVVLGSANEQEANDIESIALRLHNLFTKPYQIRNSLQIIQILSEANSADKQELIRLGLLTQLIKEIENCCQQGSLSSRTVTATSNESRRAKSGWARRPSTTSSQVSKGIGYGTGSTKSRVSIYRVLN